MFANRKYMVKLFKFTITSSGTWKSLQKSTFPNKEMIRIGNVIEIDVQDKKGKTQPMFAIIKEINSNDVLLEIKLNSKTKRS